MHAEARSSLVRLLPLVLLVLAASAPRAFGETLTVEVRDQTATPLPGSFVVVGGVRYPNGTQVTLAPGTHTIRVVPGINGGSQTSYGVGLYRVDTITVAAGQTTLNPIWASATVELRVVDGLGSAVVGSDVTLVGNAAAPTMHLGRLATPASVVLPVTTYANALGEWADANTKKGYDFRILPGINGAAQGSSWSNGMYRIDGDSTTPASPAVSVNAATTQLAFVWETRSVTLRVMDSAGNDVPGSDVSLRSLAATASMGISRLPTPAVVQLPVTTYSYAKGNWAETNNQKGYDFLVLPGINGAPQGASWSNGIYRSDGDHTTPASPTVSVNASATEVPFVWEARSVTLRVVDGAGNDIPASHVTLGGGAATQAMGIVHLATPATVLLPVTTDSYAKGAWADGTGKGYDVRIYPGVNGAAPALNVLYRDDGSTAYPTSPTVSVGPSTTDLAFEWRQMQCSPQILDAAGTPVPGSQIVPQVPPMVWSPGSLVTLPITDNSVYPYLAGQAAPGYWIALSPGDLSLSQPKGFYFEALDTGSFAPSSITIGGNTYSLGCQSDRPPTADAGLNVAITTAEWGTTILLGTATDPDGDPLTYRWLDAGGASLGGPAPVTVGGSAPLSLATLSPLPVGDHVLTLEVSDGQLTARSSMTLTVGSAPPIVSCSGNATVQAGQATYLDATASDFDGGTLSYRWTELRGGVAVPLQEGTVTAPAGGDPVALPSALLTTGAGGELPVGLHALTLSVQDALGVSSECSVTVSVIDTQAPTLAPVCENRILWPPDHEMRDVWIVANASDNAGGPVTLRVQVLSSGDSGKDDHGRAEKDVRLVSIDQVHGIIHLRLRAAKKHRGHGRTYTVQITATDAMGNASTASVRCKAPHDRSRRDHEDHDGDDAGDDDDHDD